MNIFKKFIFSSFIRPFFLTFSIVIIILLMQFLWKYIDDLIGKGLEWYIILELLWYSTITLVPIALPLSVLLASMMLTGSLSEKSELTALNSIGKPFIYIMNPLLLIAFLIAVSSFLISNYAIPYSNLKATTLMYDIMQKKLNINIQEKIFFSDIEGYSIRINNKKSNDLMEDIIIYDYTEKKGIKKIFTAEIGKMSITKDNDFLLIDLYNGESYNETISNEKEHILKTRFKEYKLVLSLSSFKMERSTSERFSNRAKTMNIKQLNHNIDSLNKEYVFSKNMFLSSFLAIEKDKKRDNDIKNKNSNMNIKNTIKSFQNYQNKQNIIKRKINRFEVELHRKLTLPIACVIMLIIGAPIGAIIKKGGFGLPVVFSIFLFLVYHVLSITGEKMVKKDLIDPFLGMWGSTGISMVIGLTLIIIVNNNYFEKIWLKKY